jgi:hypothetical protein
MCAVGTQRNGRGVVESLGQDDLKQAGIRQTGVLHVDGVLHVERYEWFHRPRVLD